MFTLIEKSDKRAPEYLFQESKQTHVPGIYLQHYVEGHFTLGLYRKSRNLVENYWNT